MFHYCYFRGNWDAFKEHSKQLLFLQRLEVGHLGIVQFTNHLVGSVENFNDSEPYKRSPGVLIFENKIKKGKLVDSDFFIYTMLDVMLLHPDVLHVY